MNRPLVLLFAVAAVGSGCRKPLPSPDFIEASNRYTSVLAVQGDDAYTSGALDPVVVQLGHVPEKSSDSAAAVALIAKIAAERARVIAAATVALNQPTAPPPTFPSFAATPQEPESTPEVVDAGVNDLARGTDLAGLQRKFVGCLISSGPIRMLGPDGGAATENEGFVLADDVSCRNRLPGFGSNVLVVGEGKVAYLLPRGSFKTVINQEDGGPIP